MMFSSVMAFLGALREAAVDPGLCHDIASRVLVFVWGGGSVAVC